MATSNLGLTTLASADQLSAFPTAFNADMAILDKAMTQVANNPIPSTSDDTPSYWHSNVPAGSYCYFTENRLTGQPIQYFIVLTLDRSGDMVQIGMAVNNKARTYRRSGTVSQGWMTPWLALDNSGNLLWTNSNTTASFAAQTIAESSLAMGLSNFNYIDVHFKYSTSYGYIAVRRFKVGTALDEMMCAGSTSRFVRFVYNASGTGVQFGDCYQDGTANNTCMIPYQIYGIV